MLKKFIVYFTYFESVHMSSYLIVSTFINLFYYKMFNCVYYLCSLASSTSAESLESTVTEDFKIKLRFSNYDETENLSNKEKNEEMKGIIFYNFFIIIMLACKCLCDAINLRRTNCFTVTNILCPNETVLQWQTSVHGLCSEICSLSARRVQ